MEPYSRNGSIIGQTMDFGTTEQYVTGYEEVFSTPVYVGGTVGATAGGTSNFTVSLTSLGFGIASQPTSTDLVIAVWAQAWSGTVGAFKLSGFTQLLNVASNDSYDAWLSVGIRWGGTSVTITGGTQGSTYAGVLAVHVWRNVDLTTPLDTLVSFVTQINTARPNPPAITTSSPNAVIIAAGAASHTRGNIGFSSTDLQNFRTVGANDSADASVGVGSYAMSTPGTFDPPQWGFNSTDDVAYSSVGTTFALKPSSALSPVYGNKKNSGIWDLHGVYDYKAGA